MRNIWRKYGAVAACAVVIWAAILQPAQAEGGREFDPVLSLTGGCGTTKVDSVPDPGCPESHALQQFSHPSVVAVDANGYVYVHNFGTAASGAEGRIDVFDASGHFLKEFGTRNLIEGLNEKFKDPLSAWIESLAVDSTGNLYVEASVDPSSSESVHLVARFTPSSYPPTASTSYGSPALIGTPEHAVFFNLAVDSGDHLFIDRCSGSCAISERGTAAEGNIVLKSGIGASVLERSQSIAVDAEGNIYASGLKPFANPIASEEEPFVSQVYVFKLPTGELKETIDGSDTPNCAEPTLGKEECGFSASFGHLALAVDTATKELFVGDMLDGQVVYQFRWKSGASRYEYESEISHSFQENVYQSAAVANTSSPTPNAGYLFVTSHPSGVGHLFAFEPSPEIGPPIVNNQSSSGVSTREAVLEAEVGPGGTASGYHFEYVDEGTYDEDIESSGPTHGFDHAVRVPASDVSLVAGNAFVPIAVPVTPLTPGTAYRFRAVVSNHCKPKEPAKECITQGEGLPGGEGQSGHFATYPAQSVPSSCSNAALRTGPSAGLPDCRAYELVTPANTNGHPPTASGIGVAASAFDSSLVTADGNSVIFTTSGGPLPGTDGTGGFYGDGYRARRNPSNGWQTESAGPSGAQSQGPLPGGISLDHDYWIWETGAGDGGSLAIDPLGTSYVREPNGSFQLIGNGSLGSDLSAHAKWIATGGENLIFTSDVRLEADAPPSGTMAIYGRNIGSMTRVLSLKPDGTPFTAGENASYQGTTPDGAAVLFKVAGVLYERRNEATLPIAEGKLAFAGVSEDGGRVFYLDEEGTDKGLWACDVSSVGCIGPGGNPPTQIAGGDASFVNVSVDGSKVYFTATEQVDDAKEGVAGKDNLYLWNGSAVRFIAVLDHLDIVGEEIPGPGVVFGGLGLWVSHAVNPSQGQGRGRANDPSRTTPNGEVLLFESHADLTGRNPSGRAEVYRYDAFDGSLRCISCVPTLAPASADASLELTAIEDEFTPVNSVSHIANVSSNGKMAFFESPDALVPEDSNDALDVYEWEASGIGGCATPQGCLHLISSGQSAAASYLYAMTPDGHDVLIRTADTLLSADRDGTPSIYDARVGGGFAETESQPCDEGDACRGVPSTAPALVAPASSRSGPGNPRPASRCPKGRHRRAKAARARCTKHAHKHRNRRHHKHRKASR